MDLTNVTKINGIAIANISKINGKLKSEIQGGEVTPPDDPTFDPETGGMAMWECTVTITSTPGATIYYEQTDGPGASAPTPSDPTEASTEYTSPIYISAGEVWTFKIKAIAVKDGASSEITSWEVRIID